MALYDTAFGFLIGVAGSCLAMGQHNKALAVALFALGFRLIFGRAALQSKDTQHD